MPDALDRLVVVVAGLLQRVGVRDEEARIEPLADDATDDGRDPARPRHERARTQAHARFFAQLAQRGDVQGARLLEREARLAERGLHGVDGNIELTGRSRVRGVDLAAGEHVSPAEHVGQAVPLLQEHLEALGAVAHHDHRGRRQRRCLVRLEMQLHQVAAASTVKPPM